VPLFNGDGSFRIEDVPVGTIHVENRIDEPSETYSAISPVTPIGALETEVTVPGSGQYSPGLGTLSLTPIAAVPTRVASSRSNAYIVMMLDKRKNEACVS